MRPDSDRATDCGDHRPPTFSRSEVKAADHPAESSLLWWVRRSNVAQGNQLPKAQALPHNLKLGARPNQSKAPIDKQDMVPGKFYGYTEKKLDFIVNFGVKYRSGQQAPPDNSSTRSCK